MFTAIFSVLLLSQFSNAVYVPEPYLFTSPALLIDYKSWGQAYEKFSAPNSETRIFKDLVEIIYDFDINRPWGPQYFPEANARLTKFQSTQCRANDKFQICKMKPNLANESDIVELKKNIQDAKLIQSLRTKWNLSLDLAFFPATEIKFNVVVSTQDSVKSRKASFWSLPEKTVNFVYKPIILISDVDTYVSGFKSEENPSFISYSSSGYLLNDWLMRNRAMEFGQKWKFALDRLHDIAQKDPTIDAEIILQAQLFYESRNQFEIHLNRLQPLVEKDPATKERFLAEKKNNRYPLEVYQAVAYDLVADTIELQAAYFKVTSSDLNSISLRQRTLESLLTLQNYSKYSTFIKLELATRSVVFSSSAIVIDQIIDPVLALTFGAEMLNLALNSGIYSDINYFDKVSAALLQDEIFAPHFIKQNFPNVFEEMKVDDSHLKSIREFSKEKQIDLLQKTLLTEKGKPHAIGLIRMYSAFLTKVPEKEFREMAVIVQQRRMKRPE